MKKIQNYINGEIVPPISGEYFDNYSPRTGKIYSLVPDSNNDDKDLGYISVSTTESKVIVKTCIKTPCKKEENRLQDSIGIE